MTITDRAEQVLAFLQECENKGYDLDSDEISHVLSLDFDYVRKANELATCPMCLKELTMEDLEIKSDLCKLCDDLRGGK